jgi:hypothetical protein
MAAFGVDAGAGELLAEEFAGAEWVQPTWTIALRSVEKNKI